MRRPILPEKILQSEIPAPAAPQGGDFIPLCIPVMRGNEWRYVRDCLDSGWVSSVGSYVNRFEETLASYVGSKHAVATVNGTSALHIALLVAGVRPDDEVLVSSLTFIAPANAIRYAGAWPVFVDAGADYWQMDPVQVVHFLTEKCRWEGGELRNRHTGRRVKAILPVHILGHPVDMQPLVEIARKFDLVVVEDSTESLGAQYRGRNVGSIGALACLSFNGNKMITTGGGGMILTDNEAWARRARHLTTQAKDDPVEYSHDEIGYNYRLTNLQAAMGCAQMEQLEGHIAAKRQIAAWYARELQGLPGVTCMPQAPWAHSAAWLFTVRIDAAEFGLDSREVLRRLGAAGIQTRPLWQPMHRSAAHAGAEFVGGTIADELWSEGLSLPCSVNLTEAQAIRVAAALRALRG